MGIHIRTVAHQHQTATEQQQLRPEVQAVLDGVIAELFARGPGFTQTHTEVGSDAESEHESMEGATPPRQ